MADKLTACGKCAWRWRIRFRWYSLRRHDYCRCEKTRKLERFNYITGELPLMIMLCQSINTDGHCAYFTPQETPE